MQRVGVEGAWLENRPSTGRLPRLDLREAWAYRELTYYLALRDLKLRYKQTAFGVAWAVLQPVAGVAIFSLVFGRLAGVPSDGLPYPVFAYAGLSVWIYFSGAVDAAAQSLVDHRDLVTKAYFPRVLAPFAAVLPGLIDLAIAWVILALLMVAYGVAPSAALLLLPGWVLALVVVALAAGLWLSALNALYRDVRYALTFVMQLWLFATPIVFPSSLIEGGWRYVLGLNPMVFVVDGFRWSLIGGPAPGLHDALSALAAAILFATGALYFGRVERRIADRI
jgi:lipopolysaccharide transport system permease protein